MKIKMNKLLSSIVSAPLVFLAALLLLTCAGLSSANATIEEVCDRATKGSEYYGYCVSTLRSATRQGGEGGFEGLAAAATELSKDNFGRNVARAHELLARAPGLPEVSARALAACAKVYELGLSKLQQAARFLEARDYYRAGTYLSTARDEAVSCGDTFTKLGIQPLMQRENDEALKLCYLSIHISQYLMDAKTR